MATDRTARFAVPAAAALLLWPALWNGYPIVFADTGTYLSQAIRHYAGWDRPVFYSVFMLPLHATVTVWPVILVQALLAAWVLHLVCRTLAPGLSRLTFIAGVGVLSGCTWLPWLVCELMPDLFTPLLVLALCLLALTQDRLSRTERLALAALTTLMIATQQSSLPLTAALLVILAAFAALTRSPTVTADPPRRWLLLTLPPVLALLALCSVNLAAFGRFAVSPFGNIFLLARVLYDGPGLAALHRDCPTAQWRLCPFLADFPANSDEFLWTHDSPLNRAGGPKLVSTQADAIIQAAIRADPVGEAHAALINTRTQLTMFASGDGLNPWPAQVTPWITRYFPAREQAAYAAARQQRGSLAVPPFLARIHQITALTGIIACGLLLPGAIQRRPACAGLLLAVLLTLPLSAAITGALSGPHDRYQARIMWLPPFAAAVAFAAIKRHPS